MCGQSLYIWKYHIAIEEPGDHKLVLLIPRIPHLIPFGYSCHCYFFPLFFLQTSSSIMRTIGLPKKMIFEGKIGING